MNQEDLKIIKFLQKHEKMRKIVIILSCMTFIVGLLLVISYFTMDKDYFLWEGTYYITIGVFLIFTNTKFIKALRLIKQLLNDANIELEEISRSEGK